VLATGEEEDRMGKKIGDWAVVDEQEGERGNKTERRRIFKGSNKGQGGKY
jgi:hypothetical protein